MAGYGSLGEYEPATRPGLSAAHRTAFLSAALAFIALLAVVLLQPGAESSSLLLRKVPMLVCGQSLCGSDVGGSESDYGEAPLPYDDSFSLSPESYDASESPTMFNGADPSGNSWRQYVPMLIWPDRKWFDDQGRFLGRSGSVDERKATVTRQVPGEEHYMLRNVEPRVYRVERP